MKFYCVSFCVFVLLASSHSFPEILISTVDPFEELEDQDGPVEQHDPGFPSFPGDEFDLDLATNASVADGDMVKARTSSKINETVEFNLNSHNSSNLTDATLGLLMELNVTNEKTMNESGIMTESEISNPFNSMIDNEQELNKSMKPIKSPILEEGEVTSTLKSANAKNFDRPSDLDTRSDGKSVLEFHPKNETLPSRFIHFSSGNVNEWQSYVDNLESFLKPYAKEAQEKNVHCDFERVLEDGEACRFDLVYLGPSCTKRNQFGYSIGKPCIILSPANFPNWVPAPYEADLTDVPDEVQRLMRIFNANFMFVTCDGATEADRKSIGPMAYLPPYQGFPSYFFPYRSNSNYLPPLMAIEFLNPSNSTRIDVICKAWAQNVNQQPFQTSLKFSLQVN